MEVQDPPATDTKPKTAFENALNEAFAGKTTDAVPDAKTDPPPKKEVKAKVETPQEKKSSTPRELFKPKGEAKTEAPAVENNEPKSAFDEITAPEFKDEKGKKGWDALKTEAKSWEAKAKQYEKEVAERKTSGRDSESLESKLAEAQKTLKEYDEIVSRARLDDHPAFRKEFVDGRQKVVDRAKSIMEESDGDPKAIETALNLKGKARAEALREASKDLDSFQAARLGRAVDELNDLDERAQAKRDTAKQSYEEIKEQDRLRGIEEKSTQSKRRSVEFDEVSRRLSDELEVLKQADGFDEWNARAKRIVKESRDYCDAHPEADPESEILSRSVGAFRDLFVESDKRAAELEKKLADSEAALKAIHSKNPSLAARNNPTQGSAAKGDSKRPFSEAFAAQTTGA